MDSPFSEHARSIELRLLTIKRKEMLLSNLIEAFEVPGGRNVQTDILSSILVTTSSCQVNIYVNISSYT